MRGFLSLEPDAATLAMLTGAQNRLRDALSRQGVSFPDRLGIVLIQWPFGTDDQLSEAAERLTSVVAPRIDLAPLTGNPSSDRPAEIGFPAEGLEAVQETAFRLLREPVDPDPPKPAFVRLARVSPPSRKVGAALRAAGATEAGERPFVAEKLALWRQTPQGFEVCRTMPVDGGRP